MYTLKLLNGTNWIDVADGYRLNFVDNTSREFTYKFVSS